VRTLGPGSVASFLKIVLDVIRVVLWAAVIAASVATLAALLLSFNPSLLSGISFEGISLGSAWVGQVAASLMLVFGVDVAGAIIIVERLRRIFLTLIIGDPFHPANVRRLQVIAMALAGLEIWRYLSAGMLHILAHGGAAVRLVHGGGVSLTAWFAVLAIMVLAEVFREGARLRGEAELTI